MLRRARVAVRDEETTSAVVVVVVLIVVQSIAHHESAHHLVRVALNFAPSVARARERNDARAVPVRV